MLAAGGCELLTRGRVVALTDPRVVHAERHDGLPAVIRAVLAGSTCATTWS